MQWWLIWGRIVIEAFYGWNFSSLQQLHMKTLSSSFLAWFLWWSGYRVPLLDCCVLHFLIEGLSGLRHVILSSLILYSHYFLRLPQGQFISELYQRDVLPWSSQCCWALLYPWTFTFSYSFHGASWPTF